MAETKTTKNATQTPATPKAAHAAVAYSGALEDVIRDVLQDAFGPQAVAAMANALRVQLNRGILEDGPAREVRYMADLLVAILGGEEGYAMGLCEATIPALR